MCVFVCLCVYVRVLFVIFLVFELMLLRCFVCVLFVWYVCVCCLCLGFVGLFLFCFCSTTCVLFVLAVCENVVESLMVLVWCLLVCLFVYARACLLCSCL